MRCIADVFLKQKSKCILKNVDILIHGVIVPEPRNIEDFEIFIEKFYQDFVFGNRNITNALVEFEDIFSKYNIESIVHKRMLLIIFENVVDYLDVVDNPRLFQWYFLVGKLIMLCILLEENTNSLTEPNKTYNQTIRMFEKKYDSLYDDKIKKLFDKHYIKIMKNITKSVNSTKKCLNELSKSPIKVFYDIMGKYDDQIYYLSKNKFDEKIFEGIDIKHAFDAYQKYGFAEDFKFIEAENVSFEMIKNVFANRVNTLYFIKLPNGFFRLKSKVTKMINIVEPNTIKNLVFLVPYSEIIERDLKVKDLKVAGFKIGIYNMKDVESKSIKLKGLVDYVFLRPSEVTNYNGIVEFSREIDAIIIENNKNSYTIYK